jgi:transcriptional regulator with XRE-family HTH domain
MSGQSARTVRIVGVEVVRRRKLAGMSREALGKKSGCSLKNLERIESDEDAAVLPYTASCLAEALGAEIRDLLVAGERPPAEPLDGDPNLAVSLNVRVWGRDGDRRRGLSIGQPGVLPVRAGDRVRVEVEASRPVYLYLVWVTSQGVAQPLYPWEEFDWARRPPDEPLDWLSLPLPEPGRGYGGWPVDTPAGIETLVAMASAVPLNAGVAAKVRGWWGGFPSSEPAPDPCRDYWFECRRGVRLAGEGTRLGAVPESLGDPVYEIQALMRDRLAGRFDLVRAVCLGNTGEERADA